MKILILVHCEETFRSWMSPSFVDNLLETLENGGYNRVIHMTSWVNDDHPIDEIRWAVGQEIEWGWGYEPEMFEDDTPWDNENRKWLIESCGHEWTLVPEELRQWPWPGAEVHIGGGCNSECLEDFRAVLEHLNIEYTDERGIIY